MKKQYRELFMVLLAVTLWTIRSDAFDLGPDILYVGDQGDNTVKSLSAKDGAKGVFVTQGTELHGPTGLLVAGGELVVVNQNAGQPSNGEILQYLLRDGSFAGPLVSKTDPNAPFAPRGVVLVNGVLSVANLTGNDAGAPGEVDVFVGNGAFLGKR